MGYHVLHHCIPERKACAALILMLSAAFMIPGCKKEDDSPSQENISSNLTTNNELNDQNEANAIPVRARLADAMVAGTRYHGVSIKADRFDPVSGFIYGVRVTAEGYLLSADHAEMIVNYSEQTARLILFDAVSVTVPTISEEKITGHDEGEMVSYDRLELESFSIKN